MNAEEKQAMRDTVEIAVSKGNEPIWEKLRDHDTEIALQKQDAAQGRVSQIAQGERLGEVESRVGKHVIYWRALWIGLTGFVGFVGWLLVKILS